MKFPLVITNYYLITGFHYNSKKKFSIRTTSFGIAMGINLWRGRVWRVDIDGKRYLLKRVFN